MPLPLDRQLIAPFPRRGQRVLMQDGLNEEIREIIRISEGSYTWEWDNTDGSDNTYTTMSQLVHVDVNSLRHDKPTYPVAWNGFCWEEVDA